ncbi:MAG TPA: MarR family transcriptional regulator [Thermodesulfobacteriota bacterium]
MLTKQTRERGRATGVDEPTATALKLWVVLSRAHASVLGHAQADAARHGLTLAEFGILEALYHKGPLLLGQVQRTLLVSSGGTTFLVDRLERKGLVERRDCPGDRRARYAVLTPRGERLVREIFPAHADAIRRAVSGLTPAEQRQATTLLRALGRTAAEGGASGSRTRRARSRRPAVDGRPAGA